MSNPLARRARIKDLSNKAEGIFQYVGNDNVLFRLISTGNKLQTTSYQDKNGNNRTKVEVVASNVSFCGSKAAERAVVKDFDQQTANHVQEAKAAQSAPQAQQTSFASQSYRAERKSPDGQPVAVPDAEAYNPDGFSIIDDSDDLPF